jgi:hypothetical protein
MMRDPLTAPADASSPDANRAGPDAPPPLPEWVVRLVTLVIRFILECSFAVRSRRSRPAPWWHQRPDLPLGSIQALAASIRGEFGNAIVWMCRRRGIGPGHPDWPELSRAIVAFGGSVKGFRPGLPACGLQWWENPDLVPGMIGETAAAPAAEAMAALLSRQAVANTPPPAPNAEPATAKPVLLPILLPTIRRPVFARTATGPPTGPPAPWGYQPVTSDERGQPMAGPAVLIRADRKPSPCLARQHARMLRSSSRYERLIPGSETGDSRPGVPRRGGRRPAIHDFAAGITGKSWMPTGACHRALDPVVGMPRLARPWVNRFADWYNTG